MKLTEVPIDSLRVTQLFLNRDKIARVSKWLSRKDQLEIPVLTFGDRRFCLDGHTRLHVAKSLGIETCFVYEDDGSREIAGLYLRFIRWCERENILTVGDLGRRTLSAARYRKNWELPCRLICEAYEAAPRSDGEGVISSRR